MIDILKKRLEAIRKIAFNIYKGSKDLSSNIKGLEREIFIKEILSKIFPNSLRFSTGEIIDEEGNRSEQVDIVLELPFEPSFPLPSLNQRLFLANSVIAVIEVKSSLGKQWNKFLKKIKKIRSLRRNIEFSMTSDFGYFIKDDFLKEKIACIGIFFNGLKDIKKIQNKLEEISENEKPDAIFTIDEGFFVHKDKDKSKEDGFLSLIAFINELSNFIQVAEYSLINYIK